MHDAFISHASADRAAADELCAALEAAGFECWMAPRDVHPGTDYASSIVEAIGSSRLMIVISSSASNASHHVPRELERAVSRGLPILPVRIETVPPSAAMEYFLSSAQWVDAPPPLTAHLPGIVAAVRRIVGEPQGSGPPLQVALGTAAGAGPPPVVPVDPAADGRSEPGRRRSRTVLAVAAGVLALAVIALGVAVVLGRDTDDSTAAVGSPGSTTTTLPESPYGGVQAGVRYEPAGVSDASPAMAASLADTAAIFAPLAPAGPAPVVVDSLTFALQRTPAALHYQAFNPTETPRCAGFMSREITVTGLWQKDVTMGPGAAAKVIAIRFADPDQAKEAFVGFSVEKGPVASECSGFKKGFGVADYDQLDVRHQEPAITGLPDGARSNSWLQPLTGKVDGFDFGLASISRLGAVVVLVVALSDVAHGPPDPAAVGQVVANILGRA